MKSVRIGIEGGGTTSRFCFRDGSSDHCEIITGSALQLTESDVTNVSNKIIQTIDNQLHESNVKIDGIYAGIAGGGSGTHAHRLTKELSDLFQCPVTICSDAESTWFTYFGYDEHGILLINGTGSVVITRPDTHLKVYGGYGPAFSEPLSGRSIGQFALKYAANAIESGKQDELSSTILEKMGASNRKEFINRIYQPTFKPAVLSKIVLEAAEALHPAAIACIQKEINELLETFTVIADVEIKDKKAAFHGGLYRNSYLSCLVKKAINERFGITSFCEAAEVSAILSDFSHYTEIPRFTR